MENNALLHIPNSGYQFARFLVGLAVLNNSGNTIRQIRKRL
jgi:hypothetical protein